MESLLRKMLLDQFNSFKPTQLRGAAKFGHWAPQEESMSMSKAFALFMQEAPAHAKAWAQAAEALDAASALDKKTEELAYIAVLAATGNTSGIHFHVLSAKSHGASRQEVLSAVLVGLPAAGSVVVGDLPAAAEAYDGQNQ